MPRPGEAVIDLQVHLFAPDSDLDVVARHGANLRIAAVENRPEVSTGLPDGPELSDQGIDQELLGERCRELPHGMLECWGVRIERWASECMKRVTERFDIKSPGPGVISSFEVTQNLDAGLIEIAVMADLPAGILDG